MGELLECGVVMLVLFVLLILVRNWMRMEGDGADVGVGDRWVCVWIGGRGVSDEECLTRVGVNVGDINGCVDSMV